MQQKNLSMIATMSKNKSNTSNSHEQVEDFEWLNPNTLEKFAPVVLACGCVIATTISVGLMIGFLKVISKG
ncbi:hypothetical protein MtrunA17_Chr8g0377861 [Medicago truncatula]|uniref:Transmembrane protein n=1 Tax=Medicago truncatula TaxID=3880 RepID=A0A396GNA9_MEDTR|nr:hypothetical protein MtrunA17_Chr8g0377861 [Medicago truncatula]